MREAGLERYEMYTELHAELRAAAEEEVQRVAGKRQREGNIRCGRRGLGPTLPFGRPRACACFVGCVPQELKLSSGLLPSPAAPRFKSRAGGKQGAEARLESKSHRRESRRSVNQWLSDLTKEAEDNL